jgi:hypothetical protein
VDLLSQVFFGLPWTLFTDRFVKKNGKTCHFDLQEEEDRSFLFLVCYAALALLSLDYLDEIKSVKHLRAGYKPLSARSQVRPSALNVGILGEKGPSPPSPDPCAGAYGRAMGDRYSPSLLNPAGPIFVVEGYLC